MSEPVKLKVKTNRTLLTSGVDSTSEIVIALIEQYLEDHQISCQDPSGDGNLVMGFGGAE